ncbi:hypothetical protein Tco_0719993 [Tanacetum coccineum]
MVVESVQFKSKNFGGNFSYPQSVPAYKNVCKYLRNCFLAEAFSQTPSVLYQNYLGEFWCTTVVDHPTPSSEDFKAQPLKESNIKFTVKNDKMTLIEVKAKLEKIATHDVLVHKNLLLKASFHAAWRILMTFVIQGFPSIADEDIHTSSFLFEEKTIDPKDSEGNMYPADKGLPATNLYEGISTSHPLPEGTQTDPKDLKRTIQLTDRGVSSTLELISHGAALIEPNTEAFILHTFGEYQSLLEDSEDEIKELSDEEMYEAREEMDDPPLIADDETQPPFSTEQPHTKEEP